MKKFLHAIKDPLWALKRTKEKYFTIPEYNKKHLSSFKKFLSDLEYDYDEYMKVTDEFMEYSDLHDFVNQKLRETKSNNIYPPERYSWPVLLYFLVRKNKPARVVETGCWYGNSSVCILLALKKNENGELFTIDLPAYFETGGYYDENPYLAEDNRISALPKGTIPGFLVPEFLRDRWTLIFGASSEKLSPLLSEMGDIDFFLHDSLHSIENMNFEFSIAYQHLIKSGILVSDNIDWNNVFKTFSNNKRAYSYLAYYESPLLKNNFGLIVKS
jgi:predicted O-methyltransferase YrrM